MSASTPRASADNHNAVVPANGSWVAELEQAKGELRKVTKSSSSSSRSTTNNDHKKALVDVSLRLCQAYSMLRQWDMLQEEAKEGLELCSENDSSIIVLRRRTFQAFRKQARIELSVTSMVDEPRMKAVVSDLIERDGHPNHIILHNRVYRNSNALQSAALEGDMRLMEVMVSHGAAIDFPFSDNAEAMKTVAPTDGVAPTDATALVMVCADLALHAHPTARPAFSMIGGLREELDKKMECAMQLVRLGADCQRKLNLDKAPSSPVSALLQVAELDGMTALELAIASKRERLIDLMQEHVDAGPLARTELVHCRCGSRLPWKQCHCTGIGQPPHYHFDEERNMIMYRLSPLAKCPCKITSKTYYKCCWKDNSRPKYLDDTNGFWFQQSMIVAPTTLFLKMEAHRQGFESQTEEQITDVIDSIRNKPDSYFHSIFSHHVRKWNVTTWDKHVYAGCIERLSGRTFFWTDLHWWLDKSELLQRVKEWNDALSQYCDDMGLQGADRVAVIEKHTASPCAPCGRAGCNAVETKVREFSRCSRCKAIAYCSRDCQKKDWGFHKIQCASCTPGVQSNK